MRRDRVRIDSKCVRLRQRVHLLLGLLPLMNRIATLLISFVGTGHSNVKLLVMVALAGVLRPCHAILSDG